MVERMVGSDVSKKSARAAGGRAVECVQRRNLELLGYRLNSLLAGANWRGVECDEQA